MVDRKCVQRRRGTGAAVPYTSARENFALCFQKGMFRSTQRKRKYLWRKSLSATVTSKFKAPQLRMYLISGRNWEEDGVAEVK